MKKNISVLLAFIGLVLIVTFALDRDGREIKSVPVKPFEQARSIKAETPDVTFTTLDGESVTLDQFKGRAVVMNFWASWCPPCVAELPDLVELASLMGEDKIALLLVSSDLNRQAIDRFVANMPEDIQEGMSSENIYMIWDERGAITRDVFQTYQLPETILIDADGNMREKVVGLVKWTSDEMMKKVKGLTK